MCPNSLARQILTSIGARAVAIKMGQQRRLLASADLPAAIDHDVDLRNMSVWSAIVDSFEVMLESGNQAIRVVGPAPGQAQFIEVVIDELPLRQAMYRFSRNVLIVALLIGGLTAGLVYLALHYLFVRPMRRLTASLIGFHENPESSARIIVPSQRGDEIGVAERELSDMQRDLVSMLHQKSRLAALGLAVSKINHDLRNLLASSQLLSDQLASVPDPRVQRFAPKLMRSLERAIAFCQSTLSYGRAQEATPDRRTILVESVVAEVRESAGLAADASITWISAIERGLAIDADPDQLFRVLLNLVRNAAQALESRPAGRWQRRSRSASRGAAREPWRSSRSPTPAPACPKKPASTCSRRSRPPAAPAAADSGLRSPLNWFAPMAARSIWSKAPSAPPSGSPSPTARWNCSRSATSGRGRSGRPWRRARPLPHRHSGARAARTLKSRGNSREIPAFALSRAPE